MPRCGPLPPNCKRRGAEDAETRRELYNQQTGDIGNN
jgi:hypothetical protein